MLVLSVLLYKITEDTVCSGSIKDKIDRYITKPTFLWYWLLNFTKNDFLQSILYKTDNLKEINSILFFFFSTPNETKTYLLALFSSSWSNSSWYTFTWPFHRHFQLYWTISSSLPTSLNHLLVTPNFTRPFLRHSQLHWTISPSLSTSLDHFSVTLK